MLFFKRIGTQKRPFTFTFSPIKLQSTSGTNTDISVQFVRGQHSVCTSTYKPNNRQVVFKDQKLSVKGTMYYNTNTRIYIQKPAIIVIKGKQLGGIEVYNIDSFEFDLSDYINKTQQRIKFDFDSGMKLTANLQFTQHQKNKKQGTFSELGTQRKINDKQNKISTQAQQRMERQTVSEKKTTQSLHMYQNQIRQKNQELETVREQNRRLNTVIAHFSEKQIPTNNANKNLLDKLYNQNESLKKKIVELQIQLSHSDTKMKRLTSNEMDTEKTIRAQARRIKDLEQQLEESKNKMATLLQDCFQQGDADMMSFIENRLKK